MDPSASSTFFFVGRPIGGLPVSVLIVPKLVFVVVDRGFTTVYAGSTLKKRLLDAARFLGFRSEPKESVRDNLLGLEDDLHGGIPPATDVSVVFVACCG